MIGIDAIANMITAGVNKIWPDANIKAEQAMELAAQINAEVQGQIDIDKVEAASTNWFIAGARPFLMWVLDIGFIYIIFARVVGLPPLDQETASSITTVLGSLLGVGYISRTVEKVQDVHGKH